MDADPSRALGPDLLHAVLALLDAASLARCMAVSRSWRCQAQEYSLWQRHCDILWEGRMSVPDAALETNAMSRLHAFSFSLVDANRVLVTAADLCKFTWEFCFKGYFQNYAILYRGGDPSSWGPFVMLRYFHPDGSITAGLRDSLFGEHENRWQIIRDVNLFGHVTRTRVMVNHWPPLDVRRTENWGWEMENRWVIYRAVRVKESHEGQSKS